MAKQLSMGQINSIVTLHESGHSNRKIAKLLGVHRETVAKYVAERKADPAKPDPRIQPGPTSTCELFREIILSKLEQGLCGQRIYQDLCDEEQGFTGSYSSVRRFLATLRQTRSLPVHRIETPAGDEAQVDFGTGAWVIGPDGSGVGRVGRSQAGLLAGVVDVVRWPPGTDLPVLLGEVEPIPHLDLNDDVTLVTPPQAVREPLPVFIVPPIKVELPIRQSLVRFEVDVLPLTHGVADVVRARRGDLIEVLLEPLHEEDMVSLAPRQQQNRLVFVLPVPCVLRVDLDVICLIGDKNRRRGQECNQRYQRAH